MDFKRISEVGQTKNVRVQIKGRLERKAWVRSHRVAWGGFGMCFDYNRNACFDKIALLALIWKGKNRPKTSIFCMFFICNNLKYDMITYKNHLAFVALPTSNFPIS